MVRSAPSSLVLIAIAGLAIPGCASTGAVPRPFPAPGSAPATPAAHAPSAANAGRAASATGYAVAGTALSLRGAPYRNGGSDPRGFDCSGLVTYAFAQNGISVPRTVGEQFHAGSAIGADVLQPGDLVFFTTVSKGASHVGIAIGGDEFVHAPSESGQVRVERLSSGYWAPRFLGARRIS